MHGAVDLLVEVDVPRVSGDARIAADPELADAARALISVERAQQELLLAIRRRVDDPAAGEAQANAPDLPRRPGRRELGERDRAFRGRLDRAAEELPAGHVAHAGVDLHAASGERQAQIGALADDPHLVGRVEEVGVALQPGVLGLTVEQHRPVQKLLERRERHARLLGQRRGRVPAHHPRERRRVHALERPAVGAADRARPLRRDIAAVAGVLRRRDRDQRVARVQHVQVERGGLADQLERRRAQPLAVVDEAAAERQAQQWVDASAAELAHDLLEQRPGGGHAPHEHLPAGLDARAGVHQQRRVALDAGVDHRRTVPAQADHRRVADRQEGVSSSPACGKRVE
ncbi:MAG TPA: hypothetical protein VHS27_18200 [Gaiellales bacterium]|nr:hypothetical protein [Gaiellales bacterium]